MTQSLGSVVANVIDYGAIPGARTHTIARANTLAIRAAIASGKQVMFPPGTYRFRGCVEFPNDEQGCEFLAGAILQPDNASSYVKITGKRQAFLGMRIEAAPDLQAHSPLLDLYGADDVVLEALQVRVTLMDTSVSGPRAAVRAMCLTGCTFDGGTIVGGLEPGTIGLWLAYSYDHAKDTDPNPSPGEWMAFPDDAAQARAQSASGASAVVASGLGISSFGLAVRVGCVSRDIELVDCTFTDNVDGAVAVRDDRDVLLDTHIRLMDPELLASAGAAVPVQSVVTGLNLASCHLGGASPPQFVWVQAIGGDGNGGGGVHGGSVVGCTFGRWATEAGEATSGNSRQASAKGPALRRVIPARATAGVTAGAVGSIRRVASATGSPAAVDLAPATAADSGSCIFLVEGEVAGFLVSGCYSASSAARSSAWTITGGAFVAETGDVMNAWAEPTLAAGDGAAALVRMTSSADGQLVVVAEEVAVASSSLGFGEASAVSPGAAFTVTGSQVERSRSLLRPGSEREVLAQLVMDLAELGLVTRR